MTEDEAYGVLGWPLEGGNFILPSEHDERDDWFAQQCRTCGGKHISRSSKIFECSLCGSNALEEIEVVND